MGTCQQKPRVIFLDAVGTLFGVKGSVGEVYSAIARQFGVAVSPDRLNSSFFQCFKAAGAPAFPNSHGAVLQAKEFSWWRQVVSQTFQQAEALDQFADFDAFFTALYAHFATADPWILYPDVRPTLAHWQRSGIRLGILSNFDSRLYQVLPALDLADFFSSVTISTEVGVAKPDRQIFAIALEKHQCSPDRAWHIGDSYSEDVKAAHTAGLHPIWIRRQ